jgi:hypothetical protein
MNKDDIEIEVTADEDKVNAYEAAIMEEAIQEEEVSVARVDKTLRELIMEKRAGHHYLTPQMEKELLEEIRITLIYTRHSI